MANVSNSVNPEQKSPSLVLNKNFANNVIKRYHFFNEAKTERDTKSHRKFENVIRKQHTHKKLSLSEKATMYSDFVAEANNDNFSKIEINKAKKGRKIISPFQQVQKLIYDAAKFNDEHEEDDKFQESKQNQNFINTTIITNENKKPVRRSRINVDKTMLTNYLKHTTVHNRLQEEEEMWEQHAVQKKRKISSLTSASAKRASSTSGSMYADKEENHAKPTRIASTKTVNNFGKYTKKLLKAKEQDPNRWNNSGFKELYADELKKSRKSSHHLNESMSFSDKKSSDEEWEENLSEQVKQNICINKNLHRKVYIAKKERTLDEIKNKSLVKPSYIKTDQNSDSKQSIKKRSYVGGLQSDLKFENVRKRKSDTVKWDHQGFDSLNNELKSEVDSSSPQRIKSLAIVKPTSVPVIDCSSDVEVKRKNDKCHNNKTKKIEKNGLEVSCDTLKSTIHGSLKKSKKRIVLESALKKIKNQAKDRENKDVLKSQESSFSDSSQSSYTISSSGSSFTSSSSDQNYSKSKKLKKKSSKHKTTFSDYDSDCLPKK